MAGHGAECQHIKVKRGVRPFFLFWRVVLLLSVMSHLLLPTKKRLLLISFLFVGAVAARGQGVPSPQQFLGYALGSHFTPHDKIVAYFQEVARAAPDKMLLKEYGRTYEGRPLLLAVVGSPENLQRLEA